MLEPVDVELPELPLVEAEPASPDDELCDHRNGANISPTAAKKHPSCRFISSSPISRGYPLSGNNQRVARLKYDVLRHLLALDYLFVVEIQLLLLPVGSRP